MDRKLHAVIIGINYTGSKNIRPLTKPIKDANTFFELLKSNFPENKDNFVLMTDESNEFYTPTYRNIKRELGDELPRRASSEDFVIIYFSGHGTPEYRENKLLASRYLVPIDADMNNVFSTCYAMDSELITLLQNRGFEASAIWIILDCCFSGGAGGKTFSHSQATSKSLSLNFSKMRLGSGWQILSACEDNELAYEGDNYSVLTTALLEVLTGNSESLKIEEERGERVATINAIHDSIIKRVKQLRPGQHPVSIGRNRELKFPILKKAPISIESNSPIFSKIKSSTEFKIPKIRNRPKNFNPYQELSIFIEFLSLSLKERFKHCEEEGLHTLFYEREGRKNFRIHKGERVLYYLDFWPGGIHSDDSIAFFSSWNKPTRDEHHGSGKIIWSNKKGSAVIDLINFSLLDSSSYGPGTSLLLTKEELLEAIWNSFVKTIELLAK